MHDVKLYDYGSIILFTPLTDAAREWMDSNLPEDAPMLGDSVAVERRYAGDIVCGMREDGLLLGV